MTPAEIIEVLGAANPLPRGVAATLPLQAGEAELVRGIVSDRYSTLGRVARPRRRSRRRVVLGLAVAAAAIAAVTVVPFGGRGSGPAPAFAAALVRFANSTPRLLLKIPGWRVVFVEQEPGAGGEMHFIRGRVDAQGMPATSRTGEASLLDRYAQLNWGPVDQIERQDIQSGHQNIPTGLGVAVTRLQLEGRTHAWMDVVAGLIFDNRAISLRVTVKNMRDLRSMLEALRQVDVTTWLEAMPPSVIKSVNSKRAIHQMLAGIPLPPGFNAAKIPGVNDTQTNYYLGTELTGAVACMWIADWNHARASHNTAAESRAIAAMATAPHWPVFRWMSRQGAWPQVLISYAKAMPSGKVAEGRAGIPLVAAVNSGLGCAQLGVDLGHGSNELQPVPLSGAQVR
jgi:hypothetical protein